MERRDILDAEMRVLEEMRDRIGGIRSELNKIKKSSDTQLEAAGVDTRYHPGSDEPGRAGNEGRDYRVPTGVTMHTLGKWDGER